MLTLRQSSLYKLFPASKWVVEVVFDGAEELRKYHNHNSILSLCRKTSFEVKHYKGSELHKVAYLIQSQQKGKGRGPVVSQGMAGRGSAPPGRRGLPGG